VGSAKTVRRCLYESTQASAGSLVKSEAGKVVIGGCVIHQGWSPTKVCRECVSRQRTDKF